MLARSRLHIPLYPHLAAAIMAAAFVAITLVVAGAPVRAADPGARETVWIPASVPTDALAGFADLYYDGMSGRLIGVEASRVAGIAALPGAVSVDLRVGEALYVYLVEDAARAEFEPPSRVLVRSGHEVVIATTGGSPALTPESAASLRGLKQPVRITMMPVPWPAGAPAQGGAALPSREVDPIIQSMLNDLTEANYVATWQHLDDFETRYAYTNQNVLASQWILDQFHAMGLQADFYYYNDGGQKRSVVATYPGLVDPSKTVYICGHFDSTSENPSTSAPGADDNASGSVAAIEAARIMSQYQFQYTLKFACFNGEEQGLLGSAAYVAQIAQAGENVVGVFDCDMIAYRGIDAAPPDFIMYTNSASQPLTQTLTDVINTYLPGQLEPIPLLSSLEGSDYASFWHHGYKAVCSIEDEAWGDDFCPWYHTSNDRIERYPRDYPLACTRANIGAAAITAIPLNPTGPYLVFGSTTISDDNAGGSAGNGDGALNPGETIELWATIRNVGQGAAQHVSGTLASQSADATVLTGTASWADIPAGGQGTNTTAFRFRINGTAPDRQVLSFDLTMTDDSGSREIPITLNVVAPALRYDFSRIVDSPIGNGNGIPDPGETFEIQVTLANGGGQDAANVQATLTSGNPHLTVLNGTAGSALISAGGRGQLAPAFRVLVTSDAAAAEILTLNLAITAGTGYIASASFPIKVGDAFWDDIEQAGEWTLGVAGDDAVTGQWVQVDPNGTTYGTPPQQVQPEDDHTADPGHICFVTGQGSVGGAAGEADVDGGKTTLVSPTFDLRGVRDPVVRYWRWYTNNLGNNPGEDTWLVQISSDGGATWVDLERTTASANTWTEETFPVSSFVTPSAQVVVKFVASDYNANSLLEAAVDDFEILGTPEPVAVQDGGRPLVLALEPARPSPTAGKSTIGFTLPAAGRAAIRLYGVDGRLVSVLVDREMTAGAHQIALDGRRFAPGVYFYHLNAGGKELSRRIVVVK